VSALKRPSAQTLQWTAGESNPDFLVASQASSRLTSSPVQISLRVTEVGVEPTKSRRSRHRRFSDLRTRSLLVFPFSSVDQ
jgi:hypothetical protein